MIEKTFLDLFPEDKEKLLRSWQKTTKRTMRRYRKKMERKKIKSEEEWKKYIRKPRTKRRKILFYFFDRPIIVFWAFCIFSVLRYYFGLL